MLSMMMMMTKMILMHNANRSNQFQGCVTSLQDIWSWPTTIESYVNAINSYRVGPSVIITRGASRFDVDFKLIGNITSNLVHKLELVEFDRLGIRSATWVSFRPWCMIYKVMLTITAIILEKIKVPIPLLLSPKSIPFWLIGQRSPKCVLHLLPDHHHPPCFNDAPLNKESACKIMLTLSWHPTLWPPLPSFKSTNHPRPTPNDSPL